MLFLVEFHQSPHLLWHEIWARISMHKILPEKEQHSDEMWMIKIYGTNWRDQILKLSLCCLCQSQTKCRHNAYTEEYWKFLVSLKSSERVPISIFPHISLIRFNFFQWMLANSDLSNNHILQGAVQVYTSINIIVPFMQSSNANTTIS